MLAAGVITGLLPLIHAHSFISIMLVATFLVPWVYRRAWVPYAAAALFGGIVFFCGGQLRRCRFIADKDSDSP